MFITALMNSLLISCTSLTKDSKSQDICWYAWCKVKHLFVGIQSGLEGVDRLDGCWRRLERLEGELDVFSWVLTGETLSRTLGFIYRMESKQGTFVWKLMEGLPKKSTECVRNRSLVLQSPCQENEEGVIIPERNGRGYQRRQLQYCWVVDSQRFVRQAD